MLKKKNIYSYSIIFVSFFIIIFSLNYFYKKFSIDPLSLNNEYKVSSVQIYGYKNKVINLVLSDIFSTKSIKKKFYKIEKLNVTQSIPTLEEGGSSLFNFNLLTNEYIDEKDLEQRLNDVYFEIINRVINDLENNLNIFDYNELKKEYLKNKKIKLEQAHDTLVSSEFFKKYPPRKCNSNKLSCLAVYSKYYNFLYDVLETDNIKYQISKYLNMDKVETKSIFFIFKDFNINQHLYENKYLDFTDEKINIYANNHELDFFKKKYHELLNTKIYFKYIYENYCKAFTDNCLRSISAYLNNVLYSHKSESKNIFSVKYIKKEEELKLNFITELPISIGLAAIFSYIFFTPFNKFFRRKTK